MIGLKKKEMPNQEIIVKGENVTLTQDCSLGAFILDKLNKFGDKTSQIYSLTGESYTFREVKKYTIRIAKQLRANEVRLGDVISICSSNNPNSSFVLLASTYIGAAVSPLDPSLNKCDVKHLMKITEPKIIFAEESSIQMIEEVIQELRLTTEIVVFGESKKYTSFLQFLNQSSANHAEDNFEPVNFSDPYDHIAYLMSSSGTSGLPKCVSISHGAMVFQLQLAMLARYPSTMVMLNMSSLFWITGVFVTLVTITIGIVRISTPPFEPLHIFQTIEKYKVNWLVLGVTYFARMVTHPKVTDYDLRSLDMVGISGAKASEKHLADGKRVFPNCKLTSSYGMTETSGNVFKLNYGVPSALGMLMPGMECKVVDIESGASLGPNQRGEVCFRGKALFSGYYKNPSATLNAVDRDGWLHSGDLGYYDDNECFYIESRIKEQFKCKGWQISPIELESVLLKHPSIKDAAVIGVPHKVDVARPRAFIVIRQNSNVTEEGIFAFMKERVNPHKQIVGGIIFVESLPTTPTGKIQRRGLIELSKQYSIDDEE